MKKIDSPAKSKLRHEIIEYLSNPSNTFVTSISGIAKILDKPASSVSNHFNAEQFAELCGDALRSRRNRYTKQSEALDQALYKKAKSGDVGALKLFFQMYEGFGERTFNESKYVVVAEPIEKGDEEGNPIKKKET